MPLWDDIFGGKAATQSGDLTGSQPSWKTWANTLDPWGERESLLSVVPQQYEYGQSNRDPGLSFGPSGNIGTGMTFDPISSIIGHRQIMEGLDLWQQTHPADFMFPGVGEAGGGRVGQAEGDFSVLNQYDQAFTTAAARFGVPANLLKAVAMVERGWEEPGGVNQSSGASGLMQVMPGIWGDQARQLGLGDFQTNPTSNIMLGAFILSDAIKRWQAAEQARPGTIDPTAEAVKDYLGRGGADANGTTADVYWNAVSGNLAKLNASQPIAGSTNWTQGFDVVFGQGNWSTPDWGAFGVESTNGLYDYGTQYGLNGTQHTGIDVPLPLNSPLAAAFSGTVVCSRTGVGNGMDSCARFEDELGAGAGRIEIISDDGNTELIYGHASKTAVQPGQRINVGDIIGYSGGQNSPHTHLEARIRDASTPSGWRIVDPRTVLGGGTQGGVNAVSNSIVEQAKKFVGLPYVWGGVPGKGAPPGSWDCSGMVYWMDQNWGNGQLPMGSHYQYQYAQQTNQLFTDPAQLQNGDLLFFDTGPDSGGGAELNHAGHVGIYIGNGQMVSALNPSAGTVISNVSDIGTYLGAMHMSWSGAGAPIATPGTGNPATPGTLQEAMQGSLYGMPSYLGQTGLDFHSWLGERLFGSDVSGQ